MTDRSRQSPAVAETATELVGDTPLLHLDSVTENLYGKVESFNPLSSIKDRVAVNMLERAREDGAVGPDTTVVEATSGNTGIGLAHAGAAMDIPVTLVMPESMSKERRQILRGLGADLELTPADAGMEGAIDRAEAIAADLEAAFIPSQFENPANPEAHMTGTGPEIDAAIDPDVIVAGVGTGGTITGVGTYFAEETDRDVEMVAIEPADSDVLSGGEPGSHDIAGIGAGFVPDILDLDVIDTIEKIEGEEARETAKQLARQEGILTGISAGAAVAVGSRIANRDGYDDQTVVAILPDTGERYLQDGLFD
jgi:cysteine synthase A